MIDSPPIKTETQTHTIQPRRAVQGLSSYIPPLEGRHEFIRLDFNENTEGFPEFYGQISPNLMMYPEYDELIAALAKRLNVPESNILLTNGSDEGLFTIAFTFTEPDVDTVITATPTFALIPHYLKLAQGKLVEIPCTPDFQYDTARIEATLKQGVKLAIFASPDNPTGAALPSDTVRCWCEAFPQTLFVLDEAYAEFSDDSALPLTQTYGNLLVTRTFSKAWGLAGLRLGLVIGQPHLLSALVKVRSPYSVNRMAVDMALRMLPQEAVILERAQSILACKAWVLDEVQTRGYRVVPGKANFFMLRVGLLAPQFCDFFRRRGILLRDQSNKAGLAGMVRVSVGTREEMTRFLAVLDEFKQRFVLLFDMDGTLVDTTHSFDVTVATLVEKYSGQPLKEGELNALRAEGGFNDDWDSTVELLKRRGITKTYDEIAPEAAELYLQLAPTTERWILEPEKLAALQKRYRLGVATGRFRPEYEPIWHERFSPLFEVVACQGDEPEVAKKPNPDLLQCALRQMNAEGGVYIGNAVDDMHAAHAAGLMAIGVTTTLDEITLRNAGADIILKSLDELGALLLP